MLGAATEAGRLKSMQVGKTMKLQPWCLAVLIAVCAVGIQAESLVWSAGGTGDWFAAGNWAPPHVPADGDSVMIGTNVVLLTNDTPQLEAFTMTGGALVFTNWPTTLSAASFTVSGGLVTVAGPFETSAPSRVHIVCSNLTLGAAGRIVADGRGYRGGYDSNAIAGAGPGGGSDGVGGSYGGVASENGMGYAARPYGSAEAPDLPGSGGGRHWYTAGSGGGAIRIEAADRVTIDGTMSANGQVGGQYEGAGSGGAIWITCRVLAGAGGRVTARGGNAGAGGYYGSGGGGRVAIQYDPAAQSAAGPPSIWLSARGGTAGGRSGDIGTLGLSDGQLLVSPLTWDGQILPAGQSDFAWPSLTLSNGWMRFPIEGLRMAVDGDLVLTGGLARLEIGRTDDLYGRLYRSIGTTGPVLHVGGNVLVGTGAVLCVFSGCSNETDYGALVSVTGDITVATNAVIWPYAQSTNGGTVLFRAAGVTVAKGGRIDATARGFIRRFPYDDVNGSGPGAGVQNSGGSHGGRSRGGNTGYTAMDWGTPVYGIATNPITAGSAGGKHSPTLYQPGNVGGGCVRIETSGDITVDGVVTTDGGAGGGLYDGGGSGGSVNLGCRALRGAGGVISANGGSGPSMYGAGGGGGRIAVRYDPVAQSAVSIPAVVMSANGGGHPAGAYQEYVGEVGTLWLPDTRFLTAVLRHSGEILIPGFTNWAVGSLLFSNCAVRLPGDGFVLAVSNDLELVGQNTRESRVDMAGGRIRCGRLLLSRMRLALTPGATPPSNAWLQSSGLLATNALFEIFAAATNAERPGTGALIVVTGGAVLASNAWIRAWSDATNGGSAGFRFADLTIDAGAGFEANGTGFRERSGAYRGLGPGGGYDSSGAGYGGVGGNGSYVGSFGGVTYGSSNAPTAPGSQGGTHTTFWKHDSGGGGLVRVEVSGTMTVNGTITANGGSAGAASYSGGGSGGGIFLSCVTLGGAGGVLSARGGNGGTIGGGGGGGGRIAIQRVFDKASGLDVTAGGGAGDAGKGSNGVDGSVVWVWLPAPARSLMIVVR